jgi:hypothetical protein
MPAPALILAAVEILATRRNGVVLGMHAKHLEVEHRGLVAFQDPDHPAACWGIGAEEDALLRPGFREFGLAYPNKLLD